MLFAVVLIGGAFSLLGAVIAGLLSQAFPSLLSDIGVNGNLIFVIFGVGLIHAVSTAPQGIAGQLQGLAGLLRRRGRTGRRCSMLEVRDLTVTFGGVKPLDGVSFELPRGVCGLVGPNGAGKTTFFNLVSGFVRPSAGDVLADGDEPASAWPRTAARAGACGERSSRSRWSTRCRPTTTCAWRPTSSARGDGSGVGRRSTFVGSTPLTASGRSCRCSSGGWSRWPRPSSAGRGSCCSTSPVRDLPTRRPSGSAR